MKRGADLQNHVLSIFEINIRTCSCLTVQKPQQEQTGRISIVIIVSEGFELWEPGR